MTDNRRPVLVIESPRYDAAADEAALLRSARFDVHICPGPGHLGRNACPLLDDRPCDILEGADVLLYDLDLDRPVDREVLHRIRHRHPQLPVVAELSTEEQRAHHHDLAGVRVVVPYDANHLCDEVHAALAEGTVVAAHSR